MYFVGPIIPLRKWTGACYIITIMDYLTRCVEATPVVDCTTATATMSLFENGVAWFGCPNISMSDQGSHFINFTISKVREKL